MAKIHPMDYLTTNKAEYKEPEGEAYAIIPVLQFLNGTPWNHIALGYCHALRPSYIRVTAGGEAANVVHWRVTVHVVGHEPIIKRINQEVNVGTYGSITDYGPAGADQFFKKASQGILT